ncbi:MAG: hypothetical protein ABI666_01640 [Ferruginibacter sp.]
MKGYLLTIVVLLNAAIAFSQPDKSKDLFAFRITDYSVKLNDSTILVQIEMTDGSVDIEEGQVAILKPNNNFTAIDTTAIGWGKCNLIKGAYNYFGIHLANNKRLPKPGDLLYTFIKYPTPNKGQIFKLLQHDIYLEHVTGERFYSFAFPMLGDKPQENSVIDSMVADIKYTATEMLKQNPEQDRVLDKGRFKGKKLFTVMQEITSADVKDFIDYVIYRPMRYAGHNWKVSEVFATWVDAGTPTANN